MQAERSFARMGALRRRFQRVLTLAVAVLLTLSAHWPLQNARSAAGGDAQFGASTMAPPVLRISDAKQTTAALRAKPPSWPHSDDPPLIGGIAPTQPGDVPAARYRFSDPGRISVSTANFDARGPPALQPSA